MGACRFLHWSPQDDVSKICVPESIVLQKKHWIQALSERPTGFLQCFDTVGLVIWPVKIVPDITYNVFGGTLNLAQSISVVFVFSEIHHFHGMTCLEVNVTENVAVENWNLQIQILSDANYIFC